MEKLVKFIKLQLENATTWFHKFPGPLAKFSPQSLKHNLVFPRLPKFNLKLFSLRRFLLGISVLLIVFLILGGFIFLRYRQLCTYQQFVESGVLKFSSDQNLCPSFLEAEKWDDILLAALNPNIAHALEVNPSPTPVANPNKCTDQLNPLCWITGTKPTLRQTDGHTNFLLVGVDSRGKNNNLANTDSMMVISLDNKTGEILLISFPRDLYIRYKRLNGYTVNHKINGVYAIDGIKGLRYTMEQILGKPIHYHAVINFGVFVKFVDEMGGIDITIDKPFKDLYPCIEVPKGKPCPKSFLRGYGIYNFAVGKHHFDSFDALVYSRARQLTSDFDRASRQQKFLKAVLQNILANEDPLPQRAEKYFKLYQLLVKEVKTDVGLKDVAGLLSLLDKLGDNPARIVVDPSLGGAGKLVYTKGIIPGAGYSIVFRDPTYKKFQAHIKNIWNYLPYYIEQPKVLVVIDPNADPQVVANTKKVISTNNPFWQFKFTNQEVDLNGVRIYSFGNSQSSRRDLQTRLQNSLIYNPSIDNISPSSWKENIVVVIGESSANSTVKD